MRPDWVLRGRRVLLPEGLREAAVGVRGGRVAWVASAREAPFGVPVVDAGESLVFPGLVDAHVHVNEPGRTEWEGFESATRAAAAGGVTAIMDMPLNCIPATTSVEALKKKLAAAEGRCYTDCGFWGGVVPGNAGELEPMREAGAAGFKCFLIDSGVDEFPKVGEPELRAALPVLARLGAPLLAHAELAPCPAPESAGGSGYGDFLAARPKSWENEAVRLLIRLAEEYGCRVHIVHLSSAEALEELARARRRGARVSAETCPHYLGFEAESVPEGATEFKCCPPIRERANRERLWEGLRAGTIDLVASDHSPCPAELKARGSGDFRAAWGGISSLQLLLPALWTEARARGIAVERLGDWLARRPAELAGLEERKGRIAEGFDADFTVWDPEKSFVADPERLRHRHKLTPYAGRTLHGVVEKTVLRGEVVYDGSGFSSAPRGRALGRADARVHGVR